MVNIPVAHDAEVDFPNAVIVEQIGNSGSALVIGASIDEAGLVTGHDKTAVTLPDVSENDTAVRSVDHGDNGKACHNGKDQAGKLEKHAF